MRLAQAARNLSITTDDIVTFLAKRDITIEKDSNTKLDETSVHLLFDYFDTEIPQKKVQEFQITAIENFEGTQNNIQDEIIDENKNRLESSKNEGYIVEQTEDPLGKLEKSEDNKNQKETNESSLHSEEIEREEVKVDNQSTHTTSLDVKNEDSAPKPKKYKTVADLLEAEENHEVDDDIVIKAPTVSLQGLNVLGKIELPEPKPKPDKEVAGKEKKESSKNRAPRRPASRNSQRELTPQQARDREKKRELRKREEAERKAKKTREQFYKENVLKPKQEQQKKRKPKKKKEADHINHQQTHKPIPKSLLGKFWRWLNT
jgi:hypothetical protein